MPLGQNQSFTTTNLNYTIMKKTTLITLLVTFFCLHLVAQTSYYVKVGGDGTDGLTEATAFTNINDAAQAAANGDTIILVGALNQSGTVGISKSLSFVGQSNAVVTATATARMYNISSGGLTVSFDNITFQNANTSLQGAVINLTQASDLTITDCIFKNNTTSANGGVILAGPFAEASGREAGQTLFAFMVKIVI